MDSMTKAAIAKHGIGTWFVGTHCTVDTILPDCQWVSICDVYGSTEEELAERQRLLAASQKLLAACQKMIEWDAAEKAAAPYDSDNGAGFMNRLKLCDEAFDMARAATAEATGVPAPAFTDDLKFGEG